MNKKKSAVGLIISILLFIVGVGVTFAAYTYSRNGLVNSKQLVGDIYMHYTESNQLILTNAMPSNTYDPTKYFEFTVDGKNTTTNKDIYYDILLSHGDVPQGKTEQNRIDDKFLKFRLVEIINSEEAEIFDNKSYNDLSTSKSIHVDIFPKNTSNEVVHIYRLYMWIGSNVVIGNTNTLGIDYDMVTWSNLFASIKVNSTGDFTEKEVELEETDASCFIYQTTHYYKVNENMTSEALQYCIESTNQTEMYCKNEEANSSGIFFQEDILGYLNPTWRDNLIENGVITDQQTDGIIITEYNCNYKDVVIPTKINNLDVLAIHTDITMGGYVNGFANKGLTSVILPKNLVIIGRGAFNTNALASVKIPNGVITIGSSSFGRNGLTNVNIPNTVKGIGSGAFENNQLTSLNIPNSVITIEGQTFAWNQLTSVNIPNSVTTIGGQAFAWNQLTSVNIPNSVTTIGGQAFSYNQLSSVSIPNSVTTIGGDAFSYNQLTNVTVGNGITSIGNGAFSKSNSTESYSNVTYYDNPNLTSITINKSCSDIKNNLQVYDTYSDTYSNYYPWLANTYGGPYTAPGVTIYGSNNEVCDTF